MSREHILTFDDPSWYARERDAVRAEILRLPSAARSGESGVQLGAPASPEVRVFIEPSQLFIEVTAFGDAAMRDLRDVIASLAGRTAVSLWDADDPDERLEPGEAFRAR